MSQAIVKKPKIAQAKVVPLRSHASTAGRSICLGVVTRRSERGLYVEVADSGDGPVLARTMLSTVPERAERCVGAQAVLLWDASRREPPIVLGLLSPLSEEHPDPVQVRVDGERLEIRGRDEIVLQCGKASITLRRNGRVVVQGTYVETASAGVNRIKGGSVKIN